MTDRIRHARSRCRPLLAALLLGLLAAAAPASASSSADQAAADAARPRHQARVVRADTPRPLFVHGKRGFLGLDLVEITPELRRHFGAEESAGVLVARVEPGAPAAQAGVAVGDVLTAIDGKPVKSSWGLRHLVAPRKGGHVVSLSVVRDGSPRQLQATLVERDARVLELGSLMEGHLWTGEDGDETVVVVPSAKQWEAFGEDMGRWGEELGSEIAEAFASPEFRARVGHEVEDRERLQKKLEVLERRLRDLEKRLADPQRR